MTTHFDVKRAWFRDQITGATIMIEIAAAGPVDWLGVRQSSQGDDVPWVQIPEPGKVIGKIKSSGWTRKGVRAMFGEDTPPELRIVPSDNDRKPG